MNSFSEFNLLPSLIKSLKEKKISKPTEIQSRSIPLLLGGQSLVGIAETGSGKTLAYALPLLHILKNLENDKNPVTEDAQPRAIVLVPTRELGEQVSKAFKTLTHETRLRVRPALGGMAFEQARRNISGPFEVLLATPGRLIQLIDRNLINLSDVRLLVFDEADQMLDQGFLPDSKLIVANCSFHPQLALFSATVSPAVQELIDSLFPSAEIIRTASSGKTVASLVTKNLIVKDGKRWPLFEELLAKPTKGGTLVFTNTREQCDKLAQELTEKGYTCGVYRGEMDKNQRRTNLKRFRDGEYDLLVATDLAGRGLDLEHVGRVINYHLPKQFENYLHRVGRTARAGRSGLVINLVTERDERLINQVEGKKSAAPKPKSSLSSKDSRNQKDSRSSKTPRSPQDSQSKARKPIPRKPAKSFRKSFSK